MIFFSNNLCYIKFFSDMYYNVFSTKADQKGRSIHKEKNLSTENHILGGIVLEMSTVCRFFLITVKKFPQQCQHGVATWSIMGQMCST